MQEQLAAIGIDMSINKVSTDEHTAYQFGDILDADGLRDYDMIMAGWEADYPDPSANLETPTPSAPPPTPPPMKTKRWTSSSRSRSSSATPPSATT